MRKTADYMAAFPGPDASHGPFRLRIYQDESDGAWPVVVVTNPTPGEMQTSWLSNSAPRLAGYVARKSLPSCAGLRWVTPHPSSDSGQEVFESSAFAVIAGGQVAYREPPREAQPLSIEPQAALWSRSGIETLIGEPLE